jgi:dipeptidyl aminopeptidase/acylaminoacyl peptidase
MARELIADGSRVGAYGSSGGGYTTVASIARVPDRYAAAVTMRGLVSYKTFGRSTRTDLQGMMRSIVGITDETQPLDLVDRIKAPVLILHGRNDPRVPVSEAELFAKALRDAGKTYRLHIYEDEGHGYRNPANRRDAYVQAVAWFDRYAKRQ